LKTINNRFRIETFPCLDTVAPPHYRAPALAGARSGPKAYWLGADR
jgi:hypothetical protein